MNPSLKFLFNVLVLSCLLLQCQEDDESQNVAVQFKFQLPVVSGSGGRTSLAELPDGAALRVSITKPNGTPVFSFKKVELFKLGDEYISESLTLHPGNYVIKHFLVVNDNDEVLYAAPNENSPLADLVEDPLPIPFEVIENGISNINVAVVSTEAHVPGDFGYASFNIELIDPIEFTLSTFITDSNGLVLTSAKAFLLQGTDTVVRELLAPTVNDINFFGDPSATYSLVVIKDAYSKYTREFVLEDLKDELDGKPLTVTLEPALTFIALPLIDVNDYLFQFYMALGSSEMPGWLAEGNVIIDWGDGQKQSYALSQLVCATCPIEHRYTTAQPRFVSITGDLDAIFSVLFNFRHGTTGTISLNQLTNLTDFRMGDTWYYSGAPATVDLSNNRMLTYLILSRSFLKTLDIADHPYLRLVYIDGTFFNTAAVDNIIDDFYNNVVDNILPNPIFLYEKSPDTGIGVGPPSQSSVDKLHYLWQFQGGEIWPL